MGLVATEKQSWQFAEGHEIAPGRTVLKPIGGGNRYEVYLVWDEKLFAVMVAKVVRPDLVEDEHALRGLRRESDALEALAHPVLLRGFGVHMDGPYPHLLVEHLEGPTLRRLIKRSGPLPLEQTLPLGLHVAAAIHYMAADGWVHLDLKPDNLVMGIPPRVIDLSLARTLERAKRLSDHIGTNAYMPPEQCDPHERRRPAFRRLGARCDALPRGGGQAPVQEAAHTRGGRFARGALPAARRRAARLAVPGARAALARDHGLPGEGSGRPAHGLRARARAAAAGGRPARQAAAGTPRADPRVSFRSWGCSTHMSMHPADTYLRLAEGQGIVQANGFSITAASPWPTPTHIVATP